MHNALKEELFNKLHGMGVSVEKKNIHFYPPQDTHSSPYQGFASVHSYDGVDLFCYNGEWVWLDPTRTDI